MFHLQSFVEFELAAAADGEEPDILALLLVLPPLALPALLPSLLDPPELVTRLSLLLIFLLSSWPVPSAFSPLPLLPLARALFVGPADS